MAPEQMRASPDIDARADIWSLGAILFELLTGQCPFEGDTMTEVCGKVLTEDPPSLSAFSNCTATELDSVIARCLQKDPNLRYQTVGEFAQALRAWRPSEDVELPEPESKRRLRRSARLPLAMVGLSALLVLGGVGFWQTHGSAASLDSQRVRPMIAAAATPIWRALPEPPKVAAEATAVQVRSRRPVSYPGTFQPAVVKNSPAVPAAEVIPAAVARAADSNRDTSNQESAPPASEASDAATNEPAVNAVDPVSGRYGL
jgi:serine/threonine protein kinase